MKFIYPILLSFFCLLSSIGYTQSLTLSGVILDPTETPIEFANVLLTHTTKPNTQKGTTSDSDGAFQLMVPEKGIYRIRVTYLGYGEWEQEINLPASAELPPITLHSNINNLEEVVVVSKLKIIERKEDKLVFNVAKSPLKSGFDGLEVLQRSPNILVDEDGNISLRDEVVTVMINGQITNLSGTNLSSYLSNLRSEDIQSIEVQSHLSANVEGESSGGVVNIILKKKPTGYNGSFQTEYTQRSKGDFVGLGGLNYNYGAQKWNIYGNYTYQKITSEYEDSYQTDYFEENQRLIEEGGWVTERDRHNYQMGFVADIFKQQTIGATFFGSNFLNVYQNPIAVTLFQNQDLSTKGDALLVGTTHNNLYNATFNYSKILDTLNSTWKVFADYADQQLDRNTISTSSYQLGGFEDNTERNNSAAQTVIYSLQTDVEKYFANGLKLEVGSKWTKTNRENRLLSQFFLNQDWLTNNRTNSFRYNERVIAGYLALNKRFQQKTFVEIGVRLENTHLERVDLVDQDKVQQQYTDWFPNAYISRDLLNDNILSFSYSKRLRRPSFYFLNNYVLKVSDFRYELGNPDLRPEYVHRFELKLQQNKQSFLLDYIKTIDAINGIYFLEDEISYYQKFNSGAQTTYGFTYNRFGNLTKWWYIKATAGIYHRKFTEEDGRDLFARTSTYFILNNTFKLNDRTNFELSGSYYSPKEDAYYIEYERYRINLMFQRSFFNKKLLARIYARDIFNQFLYKNERPFANFVNRYQLKPQTRTLRLRLVYNFNGKNKVNKRTNQSQNEVRRRL